LDHKQQLAFGASCRERLLPNSSAFQRDTGWGDISPVRRALDFVWSFLYGESIDLDEAEGITAACEAVTPSSDDFESLYVTAAQDACFAVCSLLDCLRQDDVERIVQVATYATDSVDLYVQEVENMAANDPQLERKILAHRLMQRERCSQGFGCEILFPGASAWGVSDFLCVRHTMTDKESVCQARRSRRRQS
jgi:hypothetical protein